MLLLPIVRTFLLTTLAVCASQSLLAQQNQKAFTRTFTAGTEERYHVTATIRIETRGISTEKIGEKTYVTSFSHEAEGQVSWRTTRKITAINEVGIASITELLDQFRATCDNSLESANGSPELQKSVQETCAGWQDLSQLSYEEEKFGLIRGLPQTAEEIIGPDSALLSLWLRRAFRPSVILPKTPLHFGARAAHRISNPSAFSANPEGEESLEWLEASTDIPAAILHVSQNLTWIDPPSKKNAGTITDKPNLRQLFYADSLNTISLLDGSLLKASRCATRETNEILDPVPGLPDPPSFGSTLTISVTLQRLP